MKSSSPVPSANAPAHEAPSPKPAVLVKAVSVQAGPNPQTDPDHDFLCWKPTIAAAADAYAQAGLDDPRQIDVAHIHDSFSLPELLASEDLGLREKGSARGRIPAGTYKGQDTAVETVATQLVLAGASADDNGSRGAAGPAAVLPMVGRSLSIEEARALAQAAGGQRPDPALPSAWASALEGAPTADERLGALDTALNLLVLLFLGWLVREVLRK